MNKYHWFKMLNALISIMIFAISPMTLAESSANQLANSPVKTSIKQADALTPQQEIELHKYLLKIRNKMSRYLNIKTDTPSKIRVRVRIHPTGKLQSATILNKDQVDPEIQHEVRQSLFQASPYPMPLDKDIVKKLSSFQINLLIK